MKFYFLDGLGFESYGSNDHFLFVGILARSRHIFVVIGLFETLVARPERHRAEVPADSLALVRQRSFFNRVLSGSSGRVLLAVPEVSLAVVVEPLRGVAIAFVH